MQQIKSTMKSTTTQTIMSGPRAERRASGPSRCLSHLSDKELEQYLRVSPPTSAVQSEDDDDAIDVSNDVVPASSKNKWMFEPSDSARSSAFNLQVRFMRALMQNADDQNESTPSSMVSSSLLSRDLCSTFTKIQRLNQQLQVLPLVSVLKEKVDVVTSNVNHLLSHLPLPKGAEYEDLVLLMKLSIGTSAYNVGWKIKELLALLGDVNADRLPAYFKAELKLVMKHVRNALQFGESEMKNVTVDHTLRPLEQTPIRRLIDDDTCDSGDLDLDDMLSSSDDDEHQQKLDEEEVEVGGDRDLVARRPKPVRKLVQLGDRRNDKGQKKHRRRREKKTHSTKEGRPRHILSLPSLVEGKAAPVKGKPSLLRGYGGRFVKTNKHEKSKASKTSKKAPSTAVSKARSSPMSPAAIKKSVNRVVSQVNSRTPLILRKPAAVAKPAAVVTTPSNNGSSVTVTPINRPILPINSSNKHLSEPIKLLTSLAATMMSKGIPVGEAVTTSTASVSQPRVTHSTDTAISSTTSSLKQVNSVGTNTSSGMCTSGRVEVSNLSSNTFTPIVKAISPTSTGPNGLRSATTPSSSKNQPISAVSAASRASQIQAGTQRRSNTATSTLSLSSSTLPPAVIAASSLLTLPPGPWNRLPISLPPSIVTASAIPALQNSARQGRAQSVTKAPAPLMRSSTLNGFPAPISRTSRLAMPSVTPPPSINMAPHFSFPMVAMNVTPLFSMPVVVPPGSVTVASPLTTPTVATPPVVAAALSHTPSAQTVAGPPPVSTAPSSSAAPPSATTVSVPPPISLETPNPGVSATTVSAPPSISLETPNPGVSATTVSAPSSISLETPNPGVITTSSVSRPPSDTSTSFSEAPASPVLRSSINIEAATPTTCTVTPVEGTDVLPDLPESNSSTTVVVIDPLPEAEQPRPPPSPPPATVSHTAASSSSGSGSSSATLSADAVSSDPTDSKSNPVAVSLPSSLSSSESNSVDTAALSSSSSGKASPSLVEMLSSSSAALLTSFAAQGQNAPHSVITTTSPVPRCDDSPLALLEPQRFRNLLAQYSTHTVSMANREQSMSQGIQTLSSVSADSKHKPRRSSRIQNQASISSPSVAALKASIYKRRRNSPQRKASAPSSTKDTSTQDSHRLVALSPAPLTDTCMNHLATTLNANPTLEDLKMMYSQTLTDGTTVVSTAAASSSSATTAVIVIDDDNDKYTETAFSSEEVTTSASASLSTTVSQANPAISTESQQSSASPLENSISTPPISTAAPTSENNGISKPVSQDVSPISSPPPDSVTNGDFVFPDGINPHDVTPLVQVMHDEKGVLIKWTLPKKYLKLQEGVTAYELYAHIIKGRVEEEIPPVSDWSRVGKVKPLKLPMAVTLTNVIKTKKYFFSVRALFGSETCASQFSKPSCFREDSDNFPSTKFVGL